jgi:hypothetical protein
MINILFFFYIFKNIHILHFLSYRDPQIGEEPSDLSLFQMTHMKTGEWSNTASQDVYVSTTIFTFHTIL